ncbi:hypothetical protein GGS21DRAFT_541074 [Xylaria nigripes]|nr:hypothetical protein GGS21DRAFT_541074 [Xylaria nigripes]
MTAKDPATTKQCPSLYKSPNNKAVPRFLYSTTHSQKKTNFHNKIKQIRSATMCIKAYQQFSKCDHVNTTITKCPTYYREKESSRGFFGCLFRRSSTTKPNCGKVVPHYLANDGYCQACSVKKGYYRAQRVGEGAMKVRKQGYQEIMHEEQKEAARNALRRAEKLRNPKRGVYHDVIGVESTVWLPDLYSNPETLAQKEEYARQPASAPPVSSWTQKEGHIVINNSMERARAGRKEEIIATPMTSTWLPSYGGAEPMRKPAQPASTFKYTGRYAHRTPTLPPAVGLPSLPPHYERYHVHGPKKTQKPETSHKADRTHAPEKTTKTTESSRKTDRTHSTKKIQKSESSRRAHNAKQELRKQLQPIPYDLDHDEPDSEYDSDNDSLDQILKEDAVPSPSRWDARKAAIANWIEKRGMSDKDSDISFVCRTAKAMSDQARLEQRHASRK